MNRTKWNWHEYVSPAIHVSVPEASNETDARAGDLLGNYILQIVERSPLGCRWELAVNPVYGLDRLIILKKPAKSNDELTVQGFMEGVEKGPRWFGTSKIHAEIGYSMVLIRQLEEWEKWNRWWPTEITITQLKESVPSMGHLITPMQRHLGG